MRLWTLRRWRYLSCDWMHDGSHCFLEPPSNPFSDVPSPNLFHPVVLHPYIIFVITLVVYSNFYGSLDQETWFDLIFHLFLRQAPVIRSLQFQRSWCSPEHDFRLVCALQRVCKCSKTIVIYFGLSFFKLSKAAFSLRYCAITARPHLESAMEASSTNLRVDINHLERIQRSVSRIVRDLLHTPYKEMFHQRNLISLGHRRLHPDLILAFKIFKHDINPSPSDFFLHPHL